MNAETEGVDLVRPDILLRPEGEMTIYQAAELKQAFAAALEQDGAITLDLSAVTEIDSAGLQILIALHKSAGARNKALRILNASEAVTGVFRLLEIPLPEEHAHEPR